MGLSPKQLKLVFARLRAKGLLRYIKKGKVLPPGPSLKDARSVGKAIVVMDLPRAEALIRRLPEHIQGLRSSPKIRLVSSTRALGKDNLGSYYANRGGARTITLDKTAARYALGQESSFRAFSPSARLLRGATSPTLLRRTGSIGSAKAFYHEYGHHIDLEEYSLTSTRFISNESTWRNLAEEEWSGGGYLASPEESFAEAFSFYASTRSSRNRLWRERPLTFVYMRALFEKGPESANGLDIRKLREAIYPNLRIKGLSRPSKSKAPKFPKKFFEEK